MHSIQIRAEFGSSIIDNGVLKSYGRDGKSSMLLCYFKFSMDLSLVSISTNGITASQNALHICEFMSN